MLKYLSAALVITFLPVSAAASEKDEEAFEAMTTCFSDKARELGDSTTPLDDLADVIIGMCWDRVNEHRQRWTDDWGTAWAAFVGPYFTLQVTAKAKEAIYIYRRKVSQPAS